MRFDALKPADFHILLALTGGALHGYGLVQRMEIESEGRVRLLPGNLYAMLRRLGSGGLVEECEAPEDASDRRRRYYRLTDAGRDVLAAETVRLESLVRVVRSRGVVGERGRR
ncbi:MAG: PadR family transcriptional regulator [Acidobacteriota bacterium]